MRSGRLIAGLAAVFLSATVAHAVPPDARFTLAPGAEKFLRLPPETIDIVTDPAGLLTAEVLPSGELYVTASPTAKGSATLLAVAADRVYAWDVCIGKCADETNIASAKKSCPDLAQTSEDGHPVWSVTIKDGACLEALRQALSHTTIPAQQLHLVLEEGPAMVFFARVAQAVKADAKSSGITASYYGATLMLRGQATQAAVSRAVLHAYYETVGHVSYDNQTEAPKTDGAATPPAPESPK